MNALMQLWVDGDACPGVVKDIVFRAAVRTGRTVTLVANQFVRVPSAPVIRAVQVPSGFDEADRYIVARVQPGDLVVTADVPLAADVVARGARALSPRGELYDAHNVGELLDLRNFMDGLRASGVQTGGPPPFTAGDARAFGNALDRVLRKA